ncbi:hypothetical protein DL89DRAFT_273207, partial [Linderina pennispora]
FQACLTSVLALSTAVLGAKKAASADGKHDDLVKVECAEIGEQGRELMNPDGGLPWLSQGRRQVPRADAARAVVQPGAQVPYPAQQAHVHTVPGGSSAYRRCACARRIQAQADLRQLQCRPARREGHPGCCRYVPSRDHPLPETVSGVTTMQINLRWYEGSAMTLLMSNKRHEEDFIIQPIVALMFCILTACAVYVVGRVYVESSLIPRVLKEETDRKAKARKEFEDSVKKETKKDK